MPFGNFGGNGSVQWKVDVPDDSGYKGGKKRASVTGIDPVDLSTMGEVGHKGSFTVVLTYDDKTAARAAWLAGEPKGSARKMTLYVPGRDNKPKQIEVKW